MKYVTVLSGKVNDFISCSDCKLYFICLGIANTRHGFGVIKPIFVVFLFSLVFVSITGCNAEPFQYYFFILFYFISV